MRQFLLIFSMLISALAYNNTSAMMTPFATIEARPNFETRIKIGILDSGVQRTPDLEPFFCKGGHESFVEARHKKGIHPDHGTNVARLIVKDLNPRLYCIISVQYWSETSSGYSNQMAFIAGLAHLSRQGISYLNISAGGPEGYSAEHVLLNKMAKEGVKIGVAAGNEGDNLDVSCNYFPACYNIPQNFHVVGASDTKNANFGQVVKYYDKGFQQGMPVMTGTSQATANHMNSWIRGLIDEV